MTRKEVLRDLFSKLADDAIAEKQVLDALSDLYSTSTDDYQREKLNSAKNWAEIYFSPRRWKTWKDRKQVKDFLLADIHVAGMNEP